MFASNLRHRVTPTRFHNSNCSILSKYNCISHNSPIRINLRPPHTKQFATNATTTHATQTFNMDPSFVIQTGLNQLLHMKPVVIHDSPIQKSQFNNRNDYSSFSMKISGEHFVNGSLTTLADTTIGLGAILHLPSDANRMAVIELDIQYLMSEEHLANKIDSQSEITCVANPLHKGKSLQVWDAIVSLNGETKVCLVRGTALNLYPKAGAPQGYDNVKKEILLQEFLQSPNQKQLQVEAQERNILRINADHLLSQHQKAQLIQVLHNGLSGILNVELYSWSLENKKVQTRVCIDEKHLAGTGMVHGGAINSITETTLKLACILMGCDLKQMNIHFVSSAAHIGDEFLCEVNVVETDDQRIILDAIIRHRLTNSNHEAVTGYARGTAMKTPHSEKSVKLPEFDAQRLQKLGTGFNIDTMSKKEIRDKFDKHSENWTAWTTKFKYVPVFDWIQHNCAQLSDKVRSEGKIFDMACGVGLVAQSLRKNGMKGSIVGLDISLGMLQKAFETECYSSVLCHDMDQELPFDVASFDLVTCCGATEMLANINYYLQQVNKALKLDGEAWITFQLAENGASNPIAHQGMKEYSLDQIREFMVSNGFQILDVKTTPEAYFLPSPTEKGTLLAVPFAMVRAKKISHSSTSSK